MQILKQKYSYKRLDIFLKAIDCMTLEPYIYKLFNDIQNLIWSNIINSEYSYYIFLDKECTIPLLKGDHIPQNGPYIMGNRKYHVYDLFVFQYKFPDTTIIGELFVGYAYYISAYYNKLDCFRINLEVKNQFNDFSSIEIDYFQNIFTDNRCSILPLTSNRIFYPNNLALYGKFLTPVILIGYFVLNSYGVIIDYIIRSYEQNKKITNIIYNNQCIAFYIPEEIINLYNKDEIFYTDISCTILAKFIPSNRNVYIGKSTSMCNNNFCSILGYDNNGNESLKVNNYFIYNFIKHTSSSNTIFLKLPLFIFDGVFWLKSITGGILTCDDSTHPLIQGEMISENCQIKFIDKTITIKIGADANNQCKFNNIFKFKIEWNEYKAEDIEDFGHTSSICNDITRYTNALFSQVNEIVFNDVILIDKYDYGSIYRDKYCINKININEKLDTFFIYSKGYSAFQFKFDYDSSTTKIMTLYLIEEIIKYSYSGSRCITVLLPATNNINTATNQIVMEIEEYENNCRFYNTSQCDYKDEITSNYKPDIDKDSTGYSKIFAKTIGCKIEMGQSINIRYTNELSFHNGVGGAREVLLTNDHYSLANYYIPISQHSCIPIWIPEDVQKISPSHVKFYNDISCTNETLFSRDKNRVYYIGNWTAQCNGFFCNIRGYNTRLPYCDIDIENQIFGINLKYYLNGTILNFTNKAPSLIKNSPILLNITGGRLISSNGTVILKDSKIEDDTTVELYKEKNKKNNIGSDIDAGVVEVITGQYESLFRISYQIGSIPNPPIPPDPPNPEIERIFTVMPLSISFVRCCLDIYKTYRGLWKVAKKKDENSNIDISKIIITIPSDSALKITNTGTLIDFIQLFYLEPNYRTDERVYILEGDSTFFVTKLSNIFSIDLYIPINVSIYSHNTTNYIEDYITNISLLLH